MKNIRLLLPTVMLLPVSAFAHPGTHGAYNVMTILAHFFSEPDHVLMLAVVIASLWGTVHPRRLVLVRRALHFVQKWVKRAP